MPLVAHNELPSFDLLRKEGSNILRPGRAMSQDIRELHIGLLNMMPDKALEATERQFFRLIGDSNQIVQFYVHPFTIPGLGRGKKALAYIGEHYDSFENLQKEGLDALIVTGANITDPDLSNAPFREPLQEVMEWARENVTSTICSCLATHAIMQFSYGQKRTPLKKKLWGVYANRVLYRNHPLVANMNTVFYVPHSRVNNISRAQFEAAGMKVLVEGKKSGVHIATSGDGFRMICFQGHPEYDSISLFKEYKRELGRYTAGEIKKPPPFPEGYLGNAEKKILKEYKKQIKRKKKFLPFPDEEMQELLDNTWRDSSRAIIGNWLGRVYQITNMDRRKPFMSGIDPNDPLGIKSEGKK